MLNSPKVSKAKTHWKVSGPKLISPLKKTSWKVNKVLSLIRMEISTTEGRKTNNTSEIREKIYSGMRKKVSMSKKKILSELQALPTWNILNSKRKSRKSSRTTNSLQKQNKTFKIKKSPNSSQKSNKKRKSMN